MFVFLHVPKTAGKTIVSVIKDQHTARWSELKQDIWEPKDAAQIVQNWNQRHGAALDIFHGHQAYGVDAYLPMPVTYYTMLRDPLERVISHYYYVLHRFILSDTLDGKTKGHPDRQRVLQGELTLKEYVASGYCEEMDNGQTRQMAGESGLYNRTPFGHCTPALLEQAKQNLTQQMGVVGLTEQFDASLLLIQRLCGWATPYYVRRNVTPNRPRKRDIDSQTLAAIEERIGLDRQLYAYAATLFEKQTAAQGPDFAGDVQRFQEHNRRHAPGHVRRRAVLRRMRRAGQFVSDHLPRHRARLPAQTLPSFPDLTSGS